MKPWVGIAIAVAIKLSALALGVALYLSASEKASIIRIEASPYAEPMHLWIMSLDPDKPFDWQVSGAGGRRRGQLVKLNDHDATHLRIYCKMRGAKEITRHEWSLTPGPPRLVTIEAHGCQSIEARSSPPPTLMPGF